MDLSIVETMTGMIADFEGRKNYPVDVMFRYLPSDPYTVHMTVAEHSIGPVVRRWSAATGHNVQWIFAREIMADGLIGHAGIGDVQFCSRQGDRVVKLTLTSGDGSCRIDLPRPAVAKFLARAYRAVPSGRETDQLGDIDGQLAAWMSGGGA